jgi:hypothetical protein
MAAELRRLDHKGRLSLPIHFRKGREKAVLLPLPGCVLAVLSVEDFARMKREAAPRERQYLHTLGRETAIHQETGRVQLLERLRLECGFTPLSEVVVSDYLDPKWGEQLRISTADRWEAQVGDLYALARRPDFPVPLAVPERHEKARVAAPVPKQAHQRAAWPTGADAEALKAWAAEL